MISLRNGIACSTDSRGDHEFDSDGQVENEYDLILVVIGIMRRLLNVIALLSMIATLLL